MRHELETDDEYIYKNHFGTIDDVYSRVRDI